MHSSKRFVVLDVETANSNYASICEIGVLLCCGDEILEEWSSLINPKEEFSTMNIAIHGITPDKVRDSPSFPEVSEHLSSLLTGNVVVAHSSFDRSAIKQATTKYDLAMPDAYWLDSRRLAQRAWPEMKAYGLSYLCNTLGFNYQAHAALEDAKACFFLLKQMQNTGALDAQDLITRMTKAGTRSTVDDWKETEAQGYPLEGENLVFTGALVMARSEAKLLAEAAGASVKSGVSSKTTMLVVGDQNLVALKGEEKSSKHRKAEALIENGAGIRIVGESDFMAWLKMH